MGTHNYFKQHMQHSMQPSGLNMQARAIGAGAYASRAAGGAASKDIAAAKAAAASGLKPTTKDAAANAPGPKKV